MDSSKKVNDSRNLSDNISSFQNTEGYNILDVQNDQKHTEDCLKRFKREYSDLMKKKNEIQSIKSSIKSNDIKSISPKICSKSIESSNINLYSSDELSISNLTELSSNNTIQLVEIDSDTMSDSNIDILSEDQKQKNNLYSQTFLKKNNNNEIDQHIDRHKHGKCNKEKLGCLHAESITKNFKKNQKNENIQNHEEDCIKFYGMLDELNNEIIKLKELFSKNTESNSFFNSMNLNNYNINRSTNITEMSAGEDLIDNKEYQSTQRNTFDEQMMHIIDHDDHDLYSNSKFDKNQIIFEGINHNNNECTNAHCSVHSYNTYYCD
ncbi:unnamed protein product [Macrosiphum euphorbiae]|uniref:Uncharacterized protein n=1 Tax=Macrosiphum euphorbiae TaxID=13131 RepID=A0AAV0XAS1_9HEMI|nr:unnamed protein product [Macrosiphum euphorbiae]